MGLQAVEVFFVIQLAREGRLDFFVLRIQIHIFVQKT